MRDDDALGTVHDESAGIGHERDLAHVHLLLPHFPKRACAPRSLVIEHQAQLDAQGRGIGVAPQLALLDVEDRSAEPVALVFQPRVSGIALDREHGLERRMQSLQVALLGGFLGLQKLLVGVELDREQIGRIQHAPSLAEVFPHSPAFGESVSLLGLRRGLGGRGSGRVHRLRLDLRSDRFVLIGLRLHGFRFFHVFRQVRPLLAHFTHPPYSPCRLRLRLECPIHPVHAPTAMPPR